MPHPFVTREALTALDERFGLADLYVFGSRAGEIATRVRSGVAQTVEITPAASANPDLDIGVRLPRGIRLTADRIADLAGALETLFEVGRVDLVLLNSAKPFLALDVIRGALLYTSDRDDQAEYELYVLRRAGDLAPFQRQRQALVLSRWAES